jgi:hypothetical protein
VVEVEGRAIDDSGTVYTTGRGANLVRERSAAGAEPAYDPPPTITTGRRG